MTHPIYKPYRNYLDRNPPITPYENLAFRNNPKRFIRSKQEQEIIDNDSLENWNDYLTLLTLLVQNPHNNKPNYYIPPPQRKNDISIEATLWGSTLPVLAKQYGFTGLLAGGAAYAGTQLVKKYLNNRRVQVNAGVDKQSSEYSQTTNHTLNLHPADEETRQKIIRLYNGNRQYDAIKSGAIWE